MVEIRKIITTREVVLSELGVAAPRPVVRAIGMAVIRNPMGADEEGTHERLRAHLRELVDPKIREHRGRVVKNTGDGLLAEFPSVIDAVRCAVEVQSGMAERNAAVPAPQRIEFRIGINLGDVIVEEHDIFGDGVNVAARLEALAEPGGVCVSGTVRDQIRDKLPYPFDEMGERIVKNIARPVPVYALRSEAVAELPLSDVLAASRRRSPRRYAKVQASARFHFGTIRGFLDLNRIAGGRSAPPTPLGTGLL